MLRLAYCNFTLLANSRQHNTNKHTSEQPHDTFKTPAAARLTCNTGETENLCNFLIFPHEVTLASRPVTPVSNQSMSVRKTTRVNRFFLLCWAAAPSCLMAEKYSLFYSTRAKINVLSFLWLHSAENTWAYRGETVNAVYSVIGWGERRTHCTTESDCKVKAPKDHHHL